MATTTPKPKTGTSAAKKGKNTAPVQIFGSAKKEQREVPVCFATEISPALVAQVVHIQRRRSRVRRAHTKERADVRGGGAKPWKQKGTGRSRHGSRRSPLWVGGCTTFGPRARKERILQSPLKERQKALAGAFSRHMSDATLSFLRIGKEVPLKTKEVVSLLGNERGLLIVVDEHNAEFARAARNIPGVRVEHAVRVTAKDVIDSDSVWIDEMALPVIESRCGSIHTNA